MTPALRSRSGMNIISCRPEDDCFHRRASIDVWVPTVTLYGVVYGDSSQTQAVDYGVPRG